MNVMDPICRMEIDSDQAVGKTEHNGQTFYFCSEACQKQFQKNPEHYIQGKDKKEAARLTGYKDSDLLHQDIPIVGMSCASCAITVEKSLKDVKMKQIKEL